MDIRVLPKLAIILIQFENPYTKTLGGKQKTLSLEYLKKKKEREREKEKMANQLLGLHFPNF